MTQTTSWASLDGGCVFGSDGCAIGFELAFGFNALSFVISALCISQLRRPGGFRAEGSRKKQKTTGIAQYREGVRYMRATAAGCGCGADQRGMGERRWRGSGAVPVSSEKKCFMRARRGSGLFGDARESGC